MIITVGELIKRLIEYPSKTRVMVNGYEGGIQDPGSIVLVDAWEEPHAWCGSHVEHPPYNDEYKLPDLKVLLISRSSIVNED